MQASIIVHGGAGASANEPERLRRALLACEEAARAGERIIAGGGSALDAVEAAVRVLEDAPELNAGRGSFRNLAGVIEMDAMIMDGATLGLGAVAIVRDVEHPVSLARRVMTDTKHTLLAGEGASRFADSIGFPRCDTTTWPLHPYDAARATGDTVGAVARDHEGNVAVAVSTGGIPAKMPGRIGDSPLAGSGGYADNALGAACATGDGESLMKLVASKAVCDAIARGATAQAACEALVRDLHARLGGSGGVIALSPSGELGVAFNTPAMPHAWCDAGGVHSASAV
jgi:beta-aspartyl-peptidase (threonine type)